MEAKGQITVDLDGTEVELGPDEVQVRLRAKEGFAAASAAGQVVLLDTGIDDDLRREGMAREVINRIQRVRKDRDLAYDARIEVEFAAEGEPLAAALAEHGARIANETLATRFDAAEFPADADVETTEVEGHALRFRVTGPA